MPIFVYKAKDESGKTVNGTVDAPDRHIAVGKIRDLGYWPLEVKQQGGKCEEKVKKPRGDSVFNAIWTGVSIQSQALFFRQLATMMQAGMTLGQALDSLGRQRGMGRLPGIARHAAEHVRAGGQLSDVFAAYPRVFSKMQLGLIKAAETGGLLETMIERIATYLERELELRQKFARVTFYPKILFIAILLFPFVPSLVLGGPSAMTGFIWYIVHLIILVSIIYVAFKLLMAISSVRRAWDFVKLCFPVLGTVVRKLAMSRFCTALSVMYSAGIPISQAVELSSEALGNEQLRRVVVSTIPEIRNGGKLSPALRRAGGVPDLVLGMVETGESTGNLDTTLNKVGEYYDNESVTTLEKTGYLLFVLMILIAGVIVLITAMGSYTSYTQKLGI